MTCEIVWEHKDLAVCNSMARVYGLDHIDIQVLSSHLRQRWDAVWDDLDICPRTCPTEDSRLCTYKNWFARPLGRHARSHLDLPLSTRCMQRLLRFRMAATSCPEILNAGFVCQD